jgi:hypothetical protein
VAIGAQSGQATQGAQSTAIGAAAGKTSQGSYSTAIGQSAGETNQGNYAVAVGAGAGYSAQSREAVAIGNSAGYLNQGTNAIAIGESAGWDGNFGGANVPQAARSIVLNATGNPVNGPTADATYITPLRNVDNTNFLKYNSSTYELTYYSSSDRRMKRNIQPVATSAVDEISKLKVYTFEEKDKGIQPANDETIWRPSVGVISQEVYKNAPSMRHAIYIPKDVGDIDSFVPPEDPNDPSTDWSVWGTETASLDYMMLVPHAMKAIQELNQEIINLKTKLAELENASASS